MSIKQAIVTYFFETLDLVFPNRCFCCDAFQDQLLCDRCIGEIKLKMTMPRLIPYIDQIFSLIVYEDQIKQLLGKIKFEGLREIAEKIADLTSEYIEFPPYKNIDIWCPVPIHEKRRKRRGFNQVDVLFSKFLETYLFPFDEILVREKATPPLFSYNPTQRKEILKNAFELKSGLSVNGADIVIMDDICTTGATLSEIGRYLREQGARTVNALCLCSGE